MNTSIIFFTTLSILASQTNAGEATQREANLSEIQKVIGIDVTTTELTIDAPLYARFVLVTVDKGMTKEAILADLDFPSTYFKFLNVTDASGLLGPTIKSEARCRRYIMLTTWNGEHRNSPQGRTFEFPELDVGPQSSGTTAFLQPNKKVDVRKEIVIWEDSKVSTKDNLSASQKLVLRLSADKPI